MTILWCGGEDVDLTTILPTVDTGFCDTVYARGSVIIGASNNGSMSPLFPNGGVTTCWITFRHAKQYVCGNYHILGIVNSAGIGMIISQSATAGQICLRSSVGTILATETGVSTSNGTQAKFDVCITNLGQSCNVTIYVNSLCIITYTGDLTPPSGGCNIERLKYYRSDNLTNSFFSEIIVADEDTRLMRLKTLAPSAAGDSSTNWTGAYTDIDEVTLSDSDKIYSATDNADFQCNLTGMPTGTWSVKAVKVAARCVDGSGATGIQLGVKSGGTVNVGDTQTASGYWQTKERLMQVNPVTGVAFTPAEIEALQINLRAKAL